MSFHTSDVESFHRSILLLRKDPLLERNKLNVEKGLDALNPSSLASNSGKIVLCDLEWILETLSSSASLIEIVLTFLEKVCTLHEDLRIFLRDSSNLFGLSLKFISSEVHSLKALRLIEYLVLGWRVGGSAVARLERLIQYLMKFIMDDEEKRASSVFIIVCLCHWNNSLADFILSQKEIEYLVSTKQTDLKLQALIKILIYSTSQSGILNNEAPLEDPNEMNKMESYILILTDVFCSAYVCDDLLMMRLLSEILESITKERKTKRGTEGLDTHRLAKGIILIVDFGEVSKIMTNEYIFRFIRHLLKLSPDHNGAFNLIIQLTSRRLNSSLRSPLHEAMLCLKDGISLLEDDAEIFGKEDHVDNITSQLLKTLASNTINHTDRLSILETLRSISKADFNWSEMIVLKLPSPLEFINSQIELIFEEDSFTCVGAILVELILFCKEFNDIKWKKTIEDVFLKKESVVLSLTTCLRNLCHPTILRDIKKILIAALKETPSISQKENYDDDNYCLPELTQLEVYRPRTSLVEDRIDSSIHFIRKTIDKNSFENVSSADLFELGKFQKYSTDRKAEKIEQYLNATEEAIAKKKKYVVQLESKVKKLTQLMSRMVLGDDERRSELLRRCNELKSIQSNNLCLKNEMKSALDAKIKEHVEFEENYEKLSSKALKYKEDIDALQKTIQEHFQVQEELQNSLKSEKKLNSDMVASLEKREEKIKKKDRQIEEELHLRQRLEKELETLKKDYNSHLALSKRQLDKKDKQLTEQSEELKSMKEIQNQIFNLSKKQAEKS